MTEDDSGMTPDEFLDWKCWCWAFDAESFWPREYEINPEATFIEYRAEEYDMTKDEAVAREKGNVEEKWLYATDLLVDAQRAGLNPVERANRHAEESDGDIEIDWSFAEDVGRLEVPSTEVEE